MACTKITLCHPLCGAVHIVVCTISPHTDHFLRPQLGFKTENHTATYRGFQTWMGYYHWGEDYFTHAFPQHTRVEYNAVELTSTTMWVLYLRPEPTKYNGVYSLDVFKQRIHKIISEHAQGRAPQPDASSTVDEHPLFLYIAWQNCHDPYDVSRNILRCILMQVRSRPAAAAVLPYLSTVCAGP